jgi:hypothetical protein
MNIREVAVVAVVVLVGIGGAAIPAVAATTADAAGQANETTETATTPDATANGSDNGSSPFGDQMTAFMQSSASETDDTVEAGMWSAAFERANESEKARMAHDRTDALEQRRDRLAERNRTLTERYENGSISRQAYVAQASQLSGQIASLRNSIDDTQRAAESAGVNDARLETLRTEARNMSGPETAGVARDVVAGGQGSPADRGKSPDAGSGNGLNVEGENETGNATASPGDDVEQPGATDGADGSDSGATLGNENGGVGSSGDGDDGNGASGTEENDNGGDENDGGGLNDFTWLVE